MTKVGIITFHRAMNYGALLQAYALCRTLNDLGADAKVIDYRSPTHNEGEKLVKAGEKAGLGLAAKVLFRLVKHRQFYGFMNRYLPLTERVAPEGLAFLNESFDCVVVGSDQVWNPDNIRGDDAFFLPFMRDGKKYSYAASMGGDLCRARECVAGHEGDLASFTSLSVRERVSAQVLSKSGLDARVDLDPTLLLDENTWVRIASTRPHKRPYAFMYLVGAENNIRRYAEEYARARDYDLIDNKTSIEFLLHCSPEDFVSWILNAEVMFTNSFHGTAFSVVLRKDFFVETHQGGGKENLRSRQLINELGIEGREILSPTPDASFAPIDYGAVKSVLKDMRNRSLGYLANIAGEGARR